MDSFNSLKIKYDDYLHRKNAFTDILEKIENKTKISRNNICLGLIVAIVIYLVFGYAGYFLTNVIGFLFPAYCSIKAIESVAKDDDTKWLTYWVVYAAFSLVESLTDIFLYWIPLYALLKCIFLVYLMVPTKWNGSIYLYYSLIRPYILKNQDKIDDFLTRSKNISKDIIETVSETGETILKERIVKELS